MSLLDGGDGFLGLLLTPTGYVDGGIGTVEDTGELLTDTCVATRHDVHASSLGREVLLRQRWGGDVEGLPVELLECCEHLDWILPLWHH